MSSYPELFEKQVNNYSDQNYDWNKVAVEKVFPFLDDRLPVMQEARENLLKICPSVHSKAQQVLGFDVDTTFVIYVGIGCGAGWATTFQEKPAVLFGLENVAECGWSNADAIHGLIAHELGHVFHYHWRAQNKKEPGEGVWWDLYEEGFAQRCEALVNELKPWHQAIGNDWLEWCESHKSWLADKFIQTVDAGQPVNIFFGSWFDIEGRSETGYYLGCELIRELEKKYSLKEIALLEDIETRSRAILEIMKRSNL